MKGKIGLVGMVALLMTNCTLPERAVGPGSSVAAQPDPATADPFTNPWPEAPPPEPKRKPSPTPHLAALTPPALTPLAKTVAPASPTPRPLESNFDRLIGLDQNSVTELVGYARQVVDEPPAKIWRYVGRTCELDVYFYLNLQTSVMRALHYEVRNHESTERPQQSCYDELVASASPQSGSDSPR
ncbi:MAG TPA: hypothetical protein VKT70_16190 [Stellaceae bacterium]|nr:hypothetical protein [Stellaceae bacterium]